MAVVEWIHSTTAIEKPKKTAVKAVGMPGIPAVHHRPAVYANEAPAGPDEFPAKNAAAAVR